jgi:hypothetical protein
MRFVILRRLDERRVDIIRDEDLPIQAIKTGRSINDDETGPIEEYILGHETKTDDFMRRIRK